MKRPDFDFAARIARAQEEASSSGLDGLLLSVGNDLPYLTGYEAIPLERLTMLVLTVDEVVLVVPELERPRVPCGPFEVRAWGELEDPIGIVAELAGSGRFGVGDQTWSRFLLALQERMGGASFVSATPVMSRLRIRKEPGEVELLRQAAHAADRVASRLAESRMSGRSEREIAHCVAAWLVEEGHDYASFGIVASGPNGASPHHEPSERIIERGDLVIIDFGGRLKGYCSDTTRTFSVGSADAHQRELHSLVELAQKAAVDAVRPGAAAADVDAAARSLIADAGYAKWFIHRTGHGIGLDVHEEPYIVETNLDPLQPGMAFSIEPGIYLPGRQGVRIEDIVVVTGDGVERLNRSDRSLIEVG